MAELRLEIFRRILGTLPHGPVVDLGAGHCKFSRIAHELGFPVTSVDARMERVPDDIAWPFVHSNIRGFDLTPFRIICCLGLFYHLELEDQIEFLKAANHDYLIALIVDTHTARTNEISKTANGTSYEGRIFQEDQQDPRASVGNENSFWHTEESLRRIFADHGFVAMKIPPEHAPGRSFWTLAKQ